MGVAGVSRTVKNLSVVGRSAGRGRDLLSDSDGKAFISSTCHDPGTASPAPFLCEHGQWKV